MKKILYYVSSNTTSRIFSVFIEQQRIDYTKMADYVFVLVAILLASVNSTSALILQPIPFSILLLVALLVSVTSCIVFLIFFFFKCTAQGVAILQSFYPTLFNTKYLREQYNTFRPQHNTTLVSAGNQLSNIIA